MRSRYTTLLSNYQKLATTGSAAAVLQQQLALKADNEQAIEAAEAELKALQHHSQAILAKQQLLQERQHALILLLGVDVEQSSEDPLEGKVSDTARQPAL
eukprot:1141598-Pelagomonas_calceolata.AAC.3